MVLFQVYYFLIFRREIIQTELQRSIDTKHYHILKNYLKFTKTDSTSFLVLTTKLQYPKASIPVGKLVQSVNLLCDNSIKRGMGPRDGGQYLEEALAYFSIPDGSPKVPQRRTKKDILPSILGDLKWIYSLFPNECATTQWYYHAVCAICSQGQRWALATPVMQV